MAKVNKALAAKKARGAALYFNGVMDGERYRPHYSQGFEAYSNRTAYSKVWHPHKQQGWKAARDKDIKFLNELKAHAASKEGGRTPDEKVRSKINITNVEDRVIEMMTKAA